MTRVTVMTARKSEPVRIDYPKRWFILLALLLEGLLASMFYWAWQRPESGLRSVWLVLAVALGTALFLFLVPPVFTHHLAGKRGIRLHMGLLLNTAIPYERIKAAKMTSVHRGGIRVGIGVRYFPVTQVLFVTSAFSGLVKLELDEPQMIGRILRRPVQEIVLSVSLVPAFMDLIAERAGMDRGG